MPVLLNKLLTQSSSSGDMAGINGGYGTSEQVSLLYAVYNTFNTLWCLGILMNCARSV